MEKKNNSFVTIVLVIIILGLGGFIIYDKLFNDEKVSNVINNDNNSNDDVKNTNNNLILYKYDINKNELYANDDLKFAIGDLDGIVYFYDNFIILQKANSEESSLSIFDNQGNLIKTLDKNAIKYGNYYKNLRIENNKLLVSVSNMGTTGPLVDDNLMICSCGQCNNNYANDDQMNKINNTTAFVEADYEIKFNDNNVELVQVKVLSSIKDYISKFNNKVCVSSVIN